MKKELKNIVVSVNFVIIIFGFMLLNIVTPDIEVSDSERRRLLTVPTFSYEKLFSGELFQEYEKYLLDQFVYRDAFRALKAFAHFKLFKQKDNNGIYIIDQNIYKIEYPLDEKSVLNAARKFNALYNRYLKGKNINVYYSIIPDKNYFTASRYGYLSLNYDKMLDIMHQNVKNMSYINLFDFLTIEDYYRTDIHWKQDKLINIADEILKQMGNDFRASHVNYIKNELYPFYGAYYGQAALNLKPETIVYLTNSRLENASVYDHYLKTWGKVYVTERFGSVDSYDIFLSGAKPVISIINSENTYGKELVIFRDSFGSSLAPLLLPGYSKITLVDLRYISTDILEDYLSFSPDQDVLFLYNTIILNNSEMLK